MGTLHVRQEMEVHLLSDMKSSHYSRSEDAARTGRRLVDANITANDTATNTTAVGTLTAVESTTAVDRTTPVESTTPRPVGMSGSGGGAGGGGGDGGNSDISGGSSTGGGVVASVELLGSATATNTTDTTDTPQSAGFLSTLLPGCVLSRARCLSFFGCLFHFCSRLLSLCLSDISLFPLSLPHSLYFCVYISACCRYYSLFVLLSLSFALSCSFLLSVSRTLARSLSRVLSLEFLPHALLLSRARSLSSSSSGCHSLFVACTRMCVLASQSPTLSLSCPLFVSPSSALSLSLFRVVLSVFGSQPFVWQQYATALFLFKSHTYVLLPSVHTGVSIFTLLLAH